MWESPEPKKGYDVIIVGGGGHGLGTAYYLAKEHGIKNGDMVVMEKVKKQANPLPGGGLKLPDFSKIRLPGASAVPQGFPS